MYSLQKKLKQTWIRTLSGLVMLRFCWNHWFPKESETFFWPVLTKIIFSQVKKVTEIDSFLFGGCGLSYVSLILSLSPFISTNLMQEKRTAPGLYKFIHFLFAG